MGHHQHQLMAKFFAEISLITGLILLTWLLPSSTHRYNIQIYFRIYSTKLDCSNNTQSNALILHLPVPRRQNLIFILREFSGIITCKYQKRGKVCCRKSRLLY